MVKMREDGGVGVKMYERGYPVGFEAPVVEARARAEPRPRS